MHVTLSKENTALKSVFADIEMTLVTLSFQDEKSNNFTLQKKFVKYVTFCKKN